MLCRRQVCIDTYMGSPRGCTNSTCCCLPCALQVCRIACGEEVERGSWLWRQGDPADRTAVVLSGTLSVWTRSTAALKPKLERSDGEGRCAWDEITAPVVCLGCSHSCMHGPSMRRHRSHRVLGQGIVIVNSYSCSPTLLSMTVLHPDRCCMQITPWSWRRKRRSCGGA